MKEARERCATLEDVDQSTFSRFAQYIYTGDYDPAHPEMSPENSPTIKPDSTSSGGKSYQVDIDEQHPVTPVTPIEALEAPPPAPDVSRDWNESHSWGFSTNVKKPKKNKFRNLNEPEEEPEVKPLRSKKSIMWDRFEGRNPTTFTSTLPSRKNSNACENYTEVFLCHARLYVFADKYDIQPLRQLSLHKLHRTLVEFTLYSERTGDVVELVRYSYSNTTETMSQCDDLTTLVIRYVACVVKDLAKDSEFRSLLREASSISEDLVVRLLERLD
ncbi:MAG: hypothetical protein M1814_002104 [Vezdaea aestivalis]|nr:MAG: hypothetical protein M1814_002104 [Vezdaea aestivalis]